MSQPAAASITPLGSWEVPGGDSPVRCPCYSSAVRLFCHYADRLGFTSPNVPALLSTGDPISVVFPLSRKRFIMIANRVAHRYPLAWCGVPCELARVRIGLPVLGSPIPRAFRLLALLPKRDVGDVPPLLRLGAEFLHANGASVQLSSSPCEGRLVIPYA
jgi:hypothetical protein